ncbi:hypothetical protein [Dyella sp. 20L07]|uniref:hypothetical protein n=1 Tax=Dyella sp. 20L07 TaxID=3384240 RepID=UPI003D276679
MNILQRLLSVISPTSDTSDVRLVEAAGASVDSDDDQWRRLTGDGNRDLAPMTHTRMQKLAHFLWETNVLANRLIEIPLAYLLSGGVKLRIDDEEAQAALDAHWNDGLNQWDIKLTKRARELGLFGEQCWPVFRNEGNGFVRLGYLDPALIETVVTDPDNSEQPIGIVTKRDKKGVARRYRIIVNVPEAAFTERTQAIRASFDTGDCFYFKVNDLSSATRGRSDLLAQVDWLDAYDQFLFGEIDRAAFLRAFIWDVQITGATQAEVEQRAKSISPPRPNSIRVHNENETWKAEAPNLQASDSSEGARLFRNHILGGGTIPEHWFGGAENVNRATGQAMSEPTEKMLAMRQTFLGYMLVQVGQYVARSGWDLLEDELPTDKAKILATLRVEWPEMTSKDTTKYAAALQQATVAVVALLDAGLVTDETALRVVAAMAERLGVEINVTAEIEEARKTLADRGGKDLLGVPLRKTPIAAPAAIDNTDE